MKHFYENIDGWFDFQEFYTNIVNGAPDNAVFVEIGCWKGRSAAYMAVEIFNSGKNIEFFCVDTWLGSKEHRDPNSRYYDPIVETKGALLKEFANNLSQFEFVKPILSTSIDAAKTFQDNSIDFAFIDASHETADVKNDLESWYPKIKNGGILAGHDYGWHGPKTAVNKFAKQHNLGVGVHQQSTWFLQNKTILWSADS